MSDVQASIPAVRVVHEGGWRSTSQAMVDWPIAQMSVGLTPWIVPTILLSLALGRFGTEVRADG